MAVSKVRRAPPLLRVSCGAPGGPHGGSAQARGAAGARGAGFPVELAVALAQPAHLERVQILSHEFKVRGGLCAASGAAPQCTARPHLAH